VKYLTPYVVRQLIDRLIAAGTLPEPKEYSVVWPDLAAPSDKDKAEVLKAYMEAFSKYVAGQVDMLIPPEVFFKMFVGLDADEIKEIISQAEERQEEFDEEQEELMGDEDEETQEDEEDTTD
jgi:hypothetical protein